MRCSVGARRTRHGQRLPVLAAPCPRPEAACGASPLAPSAALRRRRRRARPAFAISTRRRQKMRERCLLRSLLSRSHNTRKKCHSAHTVMSNVGRCCHLCKYIRRLFIHIILLLLLFAPRLLFVCVHSKRVCVDFDPFGFLL